MGSGTGHRGDGCLLFSVQLAMGEEQQPCQCYNGGKKVGEGRGEHENCYVELLASGAAFPTLRSSVDTSPAQADPGASPGPGSNLSLLCRPEASPLSSLR